MNRTILTLLLAVLAGSCPIVARADEEAGMTRQQDVIYGRKFGTALTMDVFRPSGKQNGAGIIMVVSGGYFSSHDAVNPALASLMTRRGYTVFAVVHGSQPRFTVPEIIEDVNRAVRFVRHHAGDYGVDPDRIGITGASAGGHLSLMLGTHGEAGDPKAKDPVDRESSRVQAVACFFPPTDLLNYGAPGHEMLRAIDHDEKFRPAFDYRERDPRTNLSVEVTDPARLREIARSISPVTFVSADDPPTLIIHGDADPLVPVQQSRLIVAKLEEAGVPTRFIVKPGAGHGWLTILADAETFGDWFDTHLKPAKTDSETEQ